MATVLLYHITGLKEAQLRLMCGSMRINVRTVMESEFHLPIGVLAGRNVSGGDKLSGSFDDEMLLWRIFPRICWTDFFNPTARAVSRLCH